MKQHLLSVAMVFLCLVAHAQSPLLLPYQAVARTSSGTLIANQSVGLRFTIHNATATGAVVFQETASATTSEFGLFIYNVGTSVNLAAVNWASGAKFMQVEIDPAGGTSYTDMGTQQMLSVPYALYAQTSGSGATGPTGAAGTNGANGATGANGLNGTNGTNGTNGATGAQGNTGPTGANGTNGTNGTNGSNGAQGNTGPTGADGTNGSNGATGPTGADGSLTGTAGGDLTGTYPNPSIAAGAVTIPKIGTTSGTASASTFLRGDGTWSSVGGSFIQNQIATPQVASFNINGGGIIGGDASIIGDGAIFGNAFIGGGTLTLGGGTKNVISYNTSGVGAPTFSTSSVGTKLLLYPTVNASNADFAIGISVGTIWHSLPQATSAYQHVFYAGTTELMRVRGDGKVGIGATNPTTKLHVSGGGFLVDGSTGGIPATGAGTRMMWYPAKAAFRVGQVSASQWDDANIGTSSIAMGFGTTASGNYSTAMGLSTTASSVGSIAVGTFSTASGSNSVSMGYGTNASGSTSVAMGQNSTASGDHSIAMGENANAPSFAEVAIGTNNTSYTPVSTSTWSASDRVFTIGNGSSVSNTSDAMVVLKNGNVGIGLSSPPTHLLEVGNNVFSTGPGAGYEFADRVNGNASGWQWYASGGKAYLYDQANALNRLAIDQTGILEVGNNIFSTGTNAGYEFADRANGNASAWQWYASGGKAYLYDQLNAQNRLSVSQGGVLEVGNTIFTSGSASGFVFADRTNGSAASWQWYATGNNANLYDQLTGTNRMSINSTGVNIPNTVLASGPSAGFKFQDRTAGNASSWQWYADGGTNGHALLYSHRNGINVMDIFPNGALLMFTGASCSAGGVWTNASDENIKDNITSLNSKDLLDKINQLNITRWKYKSTEGEYHIGPMAQQFYSLFNVGVNNVSISSIDPAGIALAGVQATNQKYDALIATMQQQIDELKAVIAAMKR